MPLVKVNDHFIKFSRKEERRYDHLIRFQDINATDNDCQYSNKKTWKLKSVRHLQRTFTLEFEVSFPTLLFAAHWYSPLSVLLVFVIVNNLLSCEKLILELLFMGNPSLTQDIDGSGFPVALQDRVIFSPSIGVLFSGWMVIMGSSV